MKKLNFYDRLFIFFMAALALVILLNIISPGTEDIQGYCELSIDTDIIKGDIAPGDVLYAYGDYPLTVIAREGSVVTLRASGIITERGFLIGGSKYIWLNMPFSAYSDTSGISGRIKKNAALSEVLPG